MKPQKLTSEAFIATFTGHLTKYEWAALDEIQESRGAEVHTDDEWCAIMEAITEKLKHEDGVWG